MTLVRQIALLLALALATIAVSLTPSAAQAHDGHGHRALSTSAPAQASTRVQRNVPVTMRAEAQIDCASPCCAGGGHRCSSCCATGLVPAHAAPALPPVASARSLAREHASPDGIVPEALPEPPRPFA